MDVPPSLVRTKSVWTKQYIVDPSYEAMSIYRSLCVSAEEFLDNRPQVEELRNRDTSVRSQPDQQNTAICYAAVKSSLLKIFPSSPRCRALHCSRNEARVSPGDGVSLPLSFSTTVKGAHKVWSHI